MVWVSVAPLSMVFMHGSVFKTIEVAGSNTLLYMQKI